MTASAPTGCSPPSTQPPLELRMQLGKVLNQGTGCGFCPPLFPASSRVLTSPNTAANPSDAVTSESSSEFTAGAAHGEGRCLPRALQDRRSHPAGGGRADATSSPHPPQPFILAKQTTEMSVGHPFHLTGTSCSSKQLCWEPAPVPQGKCHPLPGCAGASFWKCLQDHGNPGLSSRPITAAACPGTSRAREQGWHRRGPCLHPRETTARSRRWLREGWGGSEDLATGQLIYRGVRRSPGGCSRPPDKQQMIPGGFPSPREQQSAQELLWLRRPRRAKDSEAGAADEPRSSPSPLAHRGAPDSHAKGTNPPLPKCFPGRALLLFSLIYFFLTFFLASAS